MIGLSKVLRECVGIWHYSALSLVYNVVRFFSSHKSSVTHICNNLQFEAIVFIADSEIIGWHVLMLNKHILARPEVDTFTDFHGPSPESLYLTPQ